MAREAPFVERQTRRWRVLRGRMIRTLPGHGPRYPSVFMHMPKCGGTSLADAMHGTLPITDRLGVIDALSTRRAAAILTADCNDLIRCHEDLDSGQPTFDLRETLMLQHMAWGTRLIHGHVFWSDRAIRHFPQYRMVTLLRDPVARMLSNYQMARRNGVITDPVETYLATPAARRQAQVYLRYLTARNDIPEDETAEATELALTRLPRFALIGFLEDIQSFARRYREMFGVPLTIPRLNTAPDPPPAVSEDGMRRIRQLCSPDIEIHARAKELAS